MDAKMGDTVYFETEGMGLKHYFYRAVIFSHAPAGA
jgi:hypothetical protein